MRYFPSSSIFFFFAQLPPRRATLLFYFIQDDGKHVTKSRAGSPKFIILSSLPQTLTLVRLGIGVMEETGVEKKREKTTLLWPFPSLTSGWKVVKSRHHSDGAAQWQAGWTSPCSRLCEQRPCRVCAERTIARTEGCETLQKRGHCPFILKSRSY